MIIYTWTGWKYRANVSHWQVYITFGGFFVQQKYANCWKMLSLLKGQLKKKKKKKEDIL